MRVLTLQTYPRLCGFKIAEMRVNRSLSNSKVHVLSGAYKNEAYMNLETKNYYKGIP